jgi:para-nitrobenzyl esterase
VIDATICFEARPLARDRHRLWLTNAAAPPYGASVEGVVEVAGGRVRGRRRGDLWVFSGIPYARGPVGPLRWRPPQPVEPWEGVREASDFGPIAPQMPPAPGFATPADIGEGEAQSEDCLSLNIWTPGMADEQFAGTSSQRLGGRPVMVWIHGGGFTSGSGSIFLYRGSQLAQRGDVVVVTINYRLGALGFLAHPGLASPHDGTLGGGGNWGLLDQIAALNWVRLHIARFGGDPDNITVFGESAGAMSISALLGAPAAKGLFHKAVIESGPVYFHTPEQGIGAAQVIADELGVDEISRKSFGSIPPAEFLAATEVLAARPPLPGVLPLPFLPVMGGSLLPQDPLDAVSSGSVADVPLLIGTNRDELTLFALSNPKLSNMTIESLKRWITVSAPGLDPEELVNRYESARAARDERTDPDALWVALGSDWVFRWPSLRLAAAQRHHQAATFAYLFTWESPVFGGVLGSCHALEIPFVFGLIRKPDVTVFTGSGPLPERLSDEMMYAWIAFARSGDPSHLGIGEWPAWDPERRATMVFGPEIGSDTTSRVQDRPRDGELSVYERARPL